MWQRHTVNGAFFFREIEAELRTFDELFLTVLEHTHTQLWALKVGQNANRAVEIGLNLTNDPMAFCNLVLRAVAHVQAEHVCPRFVQCADHLISVGGRAKGGDDFHIPQTSHSSTYSFFSMGFLPNGIIPVELWAAQRGVTANGSRALLPISLSHATPLSHARWR